MIKIRYRDPNELSPGLHALAERAGRRTIVYLLSGLTASQRRAALRRLRQAARMGHAPRLPAAQLALAVLADRIRMAFKRTGAVVRVHPAGSTLPFAVASVATVLFLALSAVTVHMLHPSHVTRAAPAPAPASSSAPQPTRPGGPGGNGGTGSPPVRGGSQGGRPPRLTQLTGTLSPNPATTSPASSSAPRRPDPGGKPSPSAAPTPSASPSPDPSSPTVPSVPRPAAGSAPGHGTCLGILILTICLTP